MALRGKALAGTPYGAGAGVAAGQWARVASFPRFVAVGLLNAAFGYGAYSLLLWVGVHYSLAALGATVLGVLFNFKSTGVLVFSSHDNTLIFRFVGVYIVVYAAQVAALALLIALGLNAYVAGLLLLPGLALLSYFLLRSFVFVSACPRS